MALVQLAGVSKVYRSMRGADYEAVRDFSLEIEPGEFFCLLGTSGCGKTTVLNMVAGFERASAGDIRIAGRAIEVPGPTAAWFSRVEDSLYGWLSALGNVEFGLRMRGIARAEREAGSALSRPRRPGRPGTQASYRASGGMKQRIQIARVLANEPQMLLMDEPFAALDAHTRSAMQRELLKHRCKTGKTVLFITHDIDEAIILASKIGVMHAGPASKLKGVIDVALPRPSATAPRPLRRGLSPGARDDPRRVAISSNGHTDEFLARQDRGLCGGLCQPVLDLARLLDLAPELRPLSAALAGRPEGGRADAGGRLGEQVAVSMMRIPWVS